MKFCRNNARNVGFLADHGRFAPDGRTWRTVIDDKLFFAGEAASHEFVATCHGAYLTGCATARAVAESLGVTTQEKRHGTV